jgi:hypothetical protein
MPVDGMTDGRRITKDLKGICLSIFELNRSAKGNQD